MKKTIFSIVILGLAFSAQAKDETHKKINKGSETKHQAAHWGYEGKVGPEHWGDLSEKFNLCSTGENQSPIDIREDFDVELPPIKFDYSSKASKILNNGHTIQVDVKPGSSINVDGMSFELKQFHFHTPSENKINGKSYPLEAHFVHRNGDKNKFAVVAVMFEEGEANPVLQQIFEKMPAKTREMVKLDKTLDYTQLLPKEQDYYRFNGSFTTPPCTEGVYWHVMKKPLTASKAQITKFLETMHHPNNRNTQPIGARLIVD